MTKCIVIGGNTTKDKKPIRFHNFLNKALQCDSGSGKESMWANLELICKNYQSSGVDLIFAYDDNRNLGTLYFGHWNDGVVK